MSAGPFPNAAHSDFEQRRLVYTIIRCTGCKAAAAISHVLGYSLACTQMGDVVRPDSGIVTVTYGERSAQPDQNWQVETPSKAGWRAVVDIRYITGGCGRLKLQSLMYENTASRVPELRTS